MFFKKGDRFHVEYSFLQNGHKPNPSKTMTFVKEIDGLWLVKQPDSGFSLINPLNPAFEQIVPQEQSDCLLHETDNTEKIEATSKRKSKIEKVSAEMMNNIQEKAN